MKIFRAVGLGVAIIVLKLLMPEVFKAFESSLLVFFSVLQGVLNAFPNGNSLAAPADMIPRVSY